jgi:phosphotransferase system enzyme I (PtsI)
MARRVLRGIVVSEGLAAGSAFVVGTPEIRAEERRLLPAEVEPELARFERALKRVREDVRAIETESRDSLGEKAGIIATYQAFLADDTHLLDPIRHAIGKDRWSAEAALVRRFREVVTELARLPEPLPSRVPDLRDIERRLLGRLAGVEAITRLDRAPRGVIICADDLSPTQTATLDPARVLAVITDRGGATSHAAIMTRHLGIPAVVGLGTLIESVRPGDFLMVDALAGEVIVGPDRDELEGFLERARRIQESTRSVELGRGRVRTRDGEEVAILANIDSGEGAGGLRELGVAGIGLFRTEFLYIGKRVAPDEEVQTRHYAALLEAMGRRPVTFRTMDFGADKWHHRIGAGEEPNPALGLRSIRLSFAHEDVFRAQIRAMLRASVKGRPRILFPMITDLAEFRRARAIVQAVAAELRAEGVPFARSIPLGAMIEMPAAALCSRAILEEADFLSLGTNDLTQYTLAVDRANPLVSESYQPWHPAVLHLVRTAAQAARRADKEISACGEMAGSERLIPLLVGAGVRHLSMAPSRISGAVAILRRLSAKDCTRLVQAMIRDGDGERARRRFDDFLSSLAA